MRLGGLLDPARVIIPLQAEGPGDAVAELLAATAEGGQVADPAALERMRDDVRTEDVVTLGPSAFLLHFRTELVGDLVAALGVAARPMAWPADPERAARILLIVLSPPRAAVRSLQARAAFARALADPEVVAALLSARSGREVAALPGLADIELEGPLLVRDIMSPDVTSVGPETPLADAARILVRHRWEALPVVNADGEVIGLLSNRELLQHLVPAYIQRVSAGDARTPPRAAGRPGRRPLETPVGGAMTRAVLCVSEEQSVADVASLMANKHLDRCPVVKDGRLTGFLTRADIVRKLAGG